VRLSDACFDRLVVGDRNFELEKVSQAFDSVEVNARSSDEEQRALLPDTSRLRCAP
jgi:hypothetical protein